MWKLAETWALMVPLLFLALHGQPWFLGPNDNYPSEAGDNSALVVTPATAPAQALKLGVLVFMVVISIRRPRSLIYQCNHNRLLVFLGLLAIASAAWSQDPVRTIEFSSILVVNMLFAFYLVERFRPDQQIDLFIILGWIALVASFLMVAFYPAHGIDYKEGQTSPWEGIFLHKNDCAVVMCFLASGWFFRSARHVLRLVGIVYVLLVAVLLVMTESRTGWILAASLLIYLLSIETVVRFKFKDRVFILCLLALASTLLIAALATHSSEFFVLIGKDPTATGRTQIWAAVFNSIMKRPLLGFGYHAFFTAVAGESSNVTLALRTVMFHSQSGFLDVWLELGAVGLGLLLLTIAQALKNAAVCLKEDASPSVKWYLGIVLMTIVVNLDERTLMHPNFLEWVMYMVGCSGLAEAARRVRKSRGEQSSRPKADGRPSAAETGRLVARY
jgi:O-antigen ligase